MINLLKGKMILALLLILKPCLGNHWDTKKHHDFQRKHTSVVNRNPRAMQQANCPKMKLWMSCEDYFVAIWDGNGGYAFDSFEDGLDVNICYDPTQCYLFEMESYSDECEYRITLDGELSKTGTLTYDGIQVGACDDSCPGQQQLFFMSYFEGYGDVDYTFHRADQGDLDDTLMEGNAVSYCIDSDKCNIMARAKTGWTYYVHFDTDGALLDSGGFDITRTFGSCEFNCTDTTLLISTKEDENLTLSISSDEAEGIKEFLPGGQVKRVCIDDSKCSVIEGQGNANYYFLRDNVVYEKGLPSEYRYLGPCKTECTKRPVLADTERGIFITTRLATVSGMAELADFNSARYKAACWLIHDDLQQYSAYDPKLIQRYVLSLLYFTTGGPDWTTPLGFISGKDECDWSAVTCTDQFVTKLGMDVNNLQGTLASELYSLIHLESFRVSDNSFYGTIPIGISRLPLKMFDIARNLFSGTIPEDFLLIEGLENAQLDYNLLTGVIPDKYDDIQSLSEFWLGSNFLSGTIPEWIGLASGLKILYLQYNAFTGTLPENWNLDNVERIQIQVNQLSGTIPSGLFALPQLQELQLRNNKFSGPIQLPKVLTKTAIKILMLDKNKLTGSIPSEIAELRKLKTLYWHENNLSGVIPKEIGMLKRLVLFRSENNNLEGTIPFENCENFAILSSDCSAPRDVTCPCCTRCFGLFTINKDVLPCPSSILSAKPAEGSFRLEYYVENNADQLVAEEAQYKAGTSASCISPTDCMTFTALSKDPFSVSVDGNYLFDFEGYGEKELFGYAIDGTMQPNTCDEYKICNRSLLPGTPQRKLFNMITRFSGLDIFQEGTKQIESLCWWLDDLDSKSETAQKNTLNVQRYILALLFLSNGGDTWIDNQNWMTQEHECEWYGVSCNAYEGMVDEIDLSYNNLSGPMPPELGEMRGLERLILYGNSFDGPLPKELVKLLNLKTLDISDNRMGGTIHKEIHFLENLEILDINTNRFSSTLPSEIALIRGLTKLNVGFNAFSGKLFPEIQNITGLKYINVQKNLMHGRLQVIDGLMDLEYFDFSNNYFTGSLPLFGKSQHKLKVAKLNNNRFSGGIPASVEEMTSLDELLIYSNFITGSLPSQLGKLEDISSISVAYNLLKGTIPAEISSMQSLNLMHLHSNALTGNLNYFNYSIESFISDCGTTEVFPARTDCVDCSECCNVDGECITVADTWPKEYVKSAGLSPSVFVILFISGIAVILSVISVLIAITGNKLPNLPYVVRQKFQEDSVYRWFLSTSKMAWFIASLSVAFQLFIAYMFLRAGDSTYGQNLWLYSMSCPDTRTWCSSQKKTSYTGWVTFVVVVAIFLLRDFLSGFLLFYESSVQINMRGTIAAIILLIITTLSCVASAIFLYATSISNIAIVQDAVIVLFLNDIDEQILMIIQTICPGWCDLVEDNIMDLCMELLKNKVEISEKVADEEFVHDKDFYFQDVGNVANDKDDYELAANGNEISTTSIKVVGQDEPAANGDEISTSGDKPVSHEEFEVMKGDLRFVMEELKKVKEENSRLKKGVSGDVK